jgi:hypothetical protein
MTATMGLAMGQTSVRTYLRHQLIIAYLASRVMFSVCTLAATAAVTRFRRGLAAVWHAPPTGPYPIWMGITTIFHQRNVNVVRHFSLRWGLGSRRWRIDGDLVSTAPHDADMASPTPLYEHVFRDADGVRVGMLTREAVIGVAASALAACRRASRDILAAHLLIQGGGVRMYTDVRAFLQTHAVSETLTVADLVRMMRCKKLLKVGDDTTATLHIIYSTLGKDGDIREQEFAMGELIVMRAADGGAALAK